MTDADPDAPQRSLEQIVVVERHRTVSVPVDTIDWLQADGKYVVLHVGGEKHYVRGALSTFEQRLSPSRFARLHAAAIVNLDRIAEMRPTGGGDFTIVLQSGDTVALGRRYRARLPDLFGRLRSRS